MIRLDPWTCIYLALLFLIMPLPWLLAAVTAAAFHELCHMAAVRAMGGRVEGMRLGIIGAVMETDLPSRAREGLAALAGPAGSFLLVSLYRWLPHIAICAFVQGIFNLLPLYPLDGGRALRCLLRSGFRERTVTVIEWVLAAVAVAAVLRFSAALALMMAVRLLFGKIPCKEGQIGVQ